ncbi:MAG: glucose-6-phosphate isomerase [Agathobaculum sp.]|uniref:glucose-6-phosphate isomerase n=1 Tax=Agathobaculum sp. TaxID=2048138 RepID=UPI0025C2373C|nr:glucose-6-phosphate isomerase [Agathobaculum sp.]MCI7126149.1 glucose-6-phosphate isomerase [Agathobaculum sp.]MDY3711354.1 glucose-6-phosphate isomerase [Agathobaculum sp.]
MAMELKLTGLQGFVGEAELQNMAPQVEVAQTVLHSRSGAGNDFLGWLDLPENYDQEEFARIKAAAKKIQNNCEVLVVIGIGGSYLGARAAIEFVNGQMYNGVRPAGIPEVYFVGSSISSAYLNDVVKIIGARDFCINVISKSGTTTEPAIAFRIFKKLIEERYGKEGAKERIFATTDQARGALKKLADDEGYETFVVPDDVGGRFSVLTAVGLLPMAAAGVDIDAAMAGAAAARQAFAEGVSHDCAKYAALRNILYRKGKGVEILVNYEPALVMLGEWFKQLFDESEGKDHKGIFATSANFSTDLHSIGQFIQDGTRSMFETVVWVKEPRSESFIEETAEDIDGLNYLAGKSVQFVNAKAYQGTLIAHMDGGTPNIILEIDKADAWHFGYLVYFFEKACGISGYLLGVNPFDQPGVEAYKKNMFALLGKPGYEERRKELEARL